MGLFVQKVSFPIDFFTAKKPLSVKVSHDATPSRLALTRSKNTPNSMYPHFPFLYPQKYPHKVPERSERQRALTDQRTRVYIGKKKKAGG